MMVSWTRSLSVCSLVVLAAGAGCPEGGGAECTVDIDCPGTQLCLDGKCTTHDPCAGVTCDAGEVCVFGSCVPEPCTDTSCTTPPGDPGCYDLPAPCADGVCRYQAQAGRGCDDADACTRDDACTSQGACAGLPVACDDPPPPTCRDGQTLLVLAAPGQCDDGACTYPEVEVACPDGCADGACLGDPCAGVTCDAPPASECVTGWVVRIFSAPGVCSNGVCSYPFDDTFCPHGCQDGACLGDPCAGVTCDQPPADVCVDNHTLRSYDPRGDCVEGQCSYPFEDIPCENGCSDGACVGCTPAWEDVSGCNCVPTACSGCSGTKQQEDGCGHTREVACELPATGCAGTCCAGACCQTGQVCHQDACCTPEEGCPPGYACGSYTDACGQDHACGTCTGCASQCTGNQCAPASHDHTACHDGDVTWFDSCGNPEDVQQDCASWQTCRAGVCAPCSPDIVRTDGTRFVLGDPPQEVALKGINYFPAYFPPINFEHSWWEEGFYRPVLVEDELAMLESVGINLVAIGGGTPNPPPTGATDCDNLLDFLDRARAHGILVNLFIAQGASHPLPDPADVVRLPSSCGLAGHPALFAYDITWEPHFGDQNAREFLAGDWTAWLEERYGGLGNADAAFGGGHALPTDAELCAEGPSVRVAAFRRFLDDHVGNVHRRIREALLAVDPDHLIGLRTGFGGNGAQGVCHLAPFSLRAGIKHHDFVSPEGYALSWTDRQHVLDRGGFTTAYADVGKPIFWAEFGVNTDGTCPDCTASVQADFFTNVFDMMAQKGANGGAGWWFVGIRPQNALDGEHSDFGIIHDYAKQPTAVDGAGTPLRDGWLGLCATDAAGSGLYVTHDDHTGEDWSCPAGTTARGGFKPDGVAPGDGATAVGAAGRSIGSGWVSLCAADDALVLAVVSDDVTGETFSCPGGSSRAGSFKPDVVAPGAGMTGWDPAGHTVESGWMALCVREPRGWLKRVQSGLSMQEDFTCAAGESLAGTFKPNSAPVSRPVVGALRSLLPGFAPDTSRPYTAWITVDRDLHAGMWKMYLDGKQAYAAASAGGGLVGVETPCSHVDSADTQLCVGNTSYDANCPPKCLNAEWNRVEILDADGNWVRAEDHDTVEVQAGAPVQARLSAGNTGEALWLTEASAGGDQGAVRFGCNENAGDVNCRIDIPADTPWMQDAESGPAIIAAGLDQPATVVLQMVAEHVAWFGDRLALTLVPVP